MKNEVGRWRARSATDRHISIHFRAWSVVFRKEDTSYFPSSLATSSSTVKMTKQRAATNAFLMVFMAMSTTCLSFTPTVNLHARHGITGTKHCINAARTSEPFTVSPGNSRISSIARRRSSLNMVAGANPVAVKVGFAAVTGVITGGLFSGSLHAIAGPDHLAALLPRCCGQRWYKAGRIGALWGLGHGVSATLLGAGAFALKSRLHNFASVKTLMHGASSAMEIAVGASLVIIGLLGIKEAKEWESEMEVTPQTLSAAAADTGVKMQRNRSVVFNGLLHGFSWDGAPSLAPALAVASWKGNLSFLLAYAVGTTAAMAMTTTLIGEGTRKAGEILHRPDIPQKLSYVSSFIALLVGGIWMGLAFA